jgi:hypothetical protein
MLSAISAAFASGWTCLLWQSFKALTSLAQLSGRSVQLLMLQQCAEENA